MYLPTQEALIDGVRTVYRRCGLSGPDVLMLHGWVSSSRMWHSAQKALGPFCRTWAFDLPGFADSERIPLEDYQIDRWVDHAVAFIDAQGLQQPVLVGHSMGGMICARLVMKYPEVASRLILINPVVTGRTFLDLKLLADSPLQGMMTRLGHWVWPIVTSSLLSNPIQMVGGVHGANHQRGQEDWAKINGPIAIAGLRAIMCTDLSKDLARIKLPTLVVIGRLDMTAPNREGRLVAQNVPGAELVVLRAGHLPTDECPELVEPLLLTFILGQPELA